METKVIKIDENNIDAELAGKAGEVLKGGGLCAFPTETVYGLGANALDPKAVSNIFKAKGRPNDNPLIVHIAEAEQIYELVCEVNERAKAVMKHFWPGPVSIILKKSDIIPTCVSAGLDTVAIRMPSHPVARAVLKAAGVPVAAPSANTSGKPSPTVADHVFEDMNTKIDMIIDGGSCSVGLESTVLDLSGEQSVILRPGAVTAKDLEPYIGAVIGGKNDAEDGETPKAPGMKYKHYAPKAEVYAVEVGESDYTADLTELLREKQAEGKKVGILDFKSGNTYGADEYIFMGSTSEKYASKLFSALRKMDSLGTDVIYAVLGFDDDYSTALRNRLYKSAAGRVIYIG